VDVLIGGSSPGSGRRAGTIGSVLAGVSTPDGLAYIGNVGTGFTDAALRDLLERLTALETPTSPFDAVPVPHEFARSARWVRPQLSGEVAYAEIGLEGRLRHPRWRGLRKR
jgi:bifunctional non-homologous end joining protein LigD